MQVEDVEWYLRILIFGINYSPELTGCGKLSGEMAQWLAAKGHEVRVVTAPPYYPAWKIGFGYRNAYRTEHEAPNLTVYRSPLYVPERTSGAKRVLHLCSFVLASTPRMLRQLFWRPDVVFIVEPTFFGAPLALAVARLTGARAWLHVQDFEVDAAFDLNLLSGKGTIRKIADSLERFFTCAFDRVSSISPKMVERAQSKGVPPEKTVLFPNWVDIDIVHPLDPSLPNSYRTELGLQDKIVFLYSGNMGAKQGLESLGPLAQSFLDDPRVHFLFCGDGAFRPQVEAAVTGFPNVTMLPLQPFERLNDLLNAADIHLLPQRAGAADLVMPSKLTGILSSGRPVIATADPGTQVARVAEGCGIVVPPEDLNALTKAARKLIDDAPLRHELGQAARRYAVEHLGREQVLLQFEADMRAALAHK